MEDLVEARKEEFDHRFTNMTNKEIATSIMLVKNKFQAQVKVYRSKNPFSSAYATTYTGNFNYIGLNSWKLNRPHYDIVGSIAHEWGHCLEYFLKTLKPTRMLNHGDNSPVGKENTFQYWLGREIKQHAKGEIDAFIRNLGAGL